ncbi:hypothetical protein [Gloeobacter violaceus]|uniref:Gsr2431 protein n=1 Tax=Gloeobacter violaceus (strain ATCC 29082 / PCC 7421) TaxID=251221 RepID=Q7NHV4_GLOVI|nr:hypothetical protein [Gloeobacter violaceus]BAC90372.1 gsr2431 [Gloeobacter violaceus PCC 7421]
MFEKPIDFVQQDRGSGAPQPNDGPVDALSLLVESFARRTPTELEAARARAIATLKPALAPEPGTTAMEHVYGHWPGEETDEQVERALAELS